MMTEFLHLYDPPVEWESKRNDKKVKHGEMKGQISIIMDVEQRCLFL